MTDLLYVILHIYAKPTSTVAVLKSHTELQDNGHVI